jgi:hypothetical protein
MWLIDGYASAGDRLDVGRATWGFGGVAAECQSPKDKCEESLARQHPAMRAVLLGEHNSPDIPPFLAAGGGIEVLNKVVSRIAIWEA